MPIISLEENEHTPATCKDSALTRRVRGALTAWLGAEKVQTIEPEIGGAEILVALGAPRKRCRSACFDLAPSIR